MQLTVRVWPPIRLPMCCTVGLLSASVPRRHSCRSNTQSTQFVCRCRVDSCANQCGSAKADSCSLACSPALGHLDLLVSACRSERAIWVEVQAVHRLLAMPHNLQDFRLHCARCPVSGFATLKSQTVKWMLQASCRLLLQLYSSRCDCAVRFQHYPKQLARHRGV